VRMVKIKRMTRIISEYDQRRQSAKKALSD